MKKSVKVVKVLLLIVLGAGIVSAIIWSTMYLWNWLVPELFNGPVINIWQTLGLLALSRILFGRWGGGHKHSHAHGPWKNYWRQRWRTMDASERERFKEKMKEKWCFNPKSTSAAETGTSNG
ncbi:MAG: hypothetical protein KF775_02440 [Cyclobacteriaceae bacterium]|nr:hypothetical protein [Cyclobacteriaceae bacterium]